MGSGSSNFSGIWDQTFSRFWDLGLEFWVKNRVTDEKIYLVTTLIHLHTLLVMSVIETSPNAL